MKGHKGKNVYSKIKISSIAVPNTLAISWASLSDGLYLFFSRKTIVSLLTFTFLARSSWVRLYLARNSFILLFIFYTSEIEHQPGDSKDHRHPQDTCAYFHDEKVLERVSALILSVLIRKLPPGCITRLIKL